MSYALLLFLTVMVVALYRRGLWCRGIRSFCFGDVCLSINRVDHIGLLLDLPYLHSYT